MDTNHKPTIISCATVPLNFASYTLYPPAVSVSLPLACATILSKCVSLAYLLTGVDLSHISHNILITLSIHCFGSLLNTLDILQNGTSSHLSIVTPSAPSFNMNRHNTDPGNELVYLA
jgi:hypothetical protein